MQTQACPLVTVVTATIGRPTLARAMASVARAADYLGRPVVHLVVVDGPQFVPAVREMLARQRPSAHCRVQILALPSSTGRKGALCRMLGSFLAQSAYVSFVDDDNWYRRDHLKKCAELLERDRTLKWVHTGVWIVSDDRCPEPVEDAPGMPDLSESLGLLRSAFYLPFENISDTNCFFLRAEVARRVAHHWQRDLMRGPLVIDDRIVYWALLDLFPHHAFVFEPTVYYTPSSPEHLEQFKAGNRRVGEQVRKHMGSTFLFRPSRARVLTLRGLRGFRNVIIRNIARRGMRWDA